ncbi:hypothetical protein M433DRAFT_63819 [Acidomyces richmondensis BFW]|nr:MAG: hypothetical protein FE78DRAFT_143399 [Acidomyces sp. 'richmondensis']KYG47094.1 hypothetical protein M433DRAFT_63819 [Acidomyces richmondensis BFW]
MSHNPAEESGLIFMPSYEAERIATKIKSRLSRCEQSKGLMRKSRDQNSSARLRSMAGLLSDMAPDEKYNQIEHSSQKFTIPVLLSGMPYPPCTVPINELRHICLSDLHIETHHRGSLLMLQRTSPVVKFRTYSWTVVRDRYSDEIERLELHMHHSWHGEDVLESASHMALKEPYFTLNNDGETVLRVDHPSDIVILADNDGCAVSPYLLKDCPIPGAETSRNRSSQRCKEIGNKALRKGLLLKAYRCYSEGLEIQRMNSTAVEDINADLLRNRAHLHLLSGSFDLAKADAVAAIRQKNIQLDAKAFFRAGCAAYNLGQFEEARVFFEEQLHLIPDDKDGIAQLNKTELRLKERISGVYDFVSLKNRLVRTNLRIDVGSFVDVTKIGNSCGKGRGLFATRNINVGELILCEKAFCAIFANENQAWTAMAYDIRRDTLKGHPAGLTQAVVRKLIGNPSQVEKVLDLYAEYEGIGKKLIKVDGTPVIDAFHIYDIVAKNAFGLDYMSSFGGVEEIAGRYGAGLWIRSSYSNHSCVPNAEKEILGDLMILRAAKKICEGEEITLSYIRPGNYSERQNVLNTDWGFQCTCSLCIAQGLGVQEISLDVADRIPS